MLAFPNEYFRDCPMPPRFVVETTIARGLRLMFSESYISKGHLGNARDFCWNFLGFQSNLQIIQEHISFGTVYRSEFSLSGRDPDIWDRIVRRCGWVEFKSKTCRLAL